MASVETEVKEHVGYIIFNRPEKMNALNMEMFDRFEALFKQYRDDPEVLVVVITGTGRAFSTGFDLTAMSKQKKYGDTFELYGGMMAYPKPTIAAVNGLCLAQGAGIALSCDIRIASEDAQMGWTQAKRGICSVSGPSLGPSFLPLGTVFESLFTGRFLSADDCYRFSIFNHVYAADQLMAETYKLAQEIVASAPLAVRSMKDTVRFGVGMSLEARMKFAGEMANAILVTEDAREGLTAFAEKRKPVWNGK